MHTTITKIEILTTVCGVKEVLCELPGYSKEHAMLVIHRETPHQVKL